MPRCGNVSLAQDAAEQVGAPCGESAATTVSDKKNTGRGNTGNSSNNTTGGSMSLVDLLRLLEGSGK